MQIMPLLKKIKCTPWRNKCPLFISDFKRMVYFINLFYKNTVVIAYSHSFLLINAGVHCRPSGLIYSCLHNELVKTQVVTSTGTVKC